VRVALADEQQHPLTDELMSAVEAAAGDLGHYCERISDPRRERDFDALLLIGYPHYYPSFARSPRAARRIAWFGETLPIAEPTMAQRVLRMLPSARLLDIAHDTLGRLAGDGLRTRLLRWRERAAVEREWAANLTRLANARRWIDELVVTSSARARGARLAGWTARRVPFGYHAAMCGPLVRPDVLPRDIDVLVLGRDVQARGRRARWLEAFKAGLGGGARLEIVDRGVYGAERHMLLARTRVVVDIHRMPGNSSGIRYVLAVAAGAALVTEDSDDIWMPAADRNAVSAPRDALAASTQNLLGDEVKRQRLVLGGQALLRGGLSMASCLLRVLEHGVEPAE
jgi:hypothetical protein